MNLITRGMRSSRREISLMEISRDIICSNEGRDGARTATFKKNKSLQ